MRACAPGKVVISGAYAVLEGAPALVSAVSRYAIADTTQLPDFITEEVRASGIAKVPRFDASELRAQTRKLGLGSSAAILVASLAANELELNPDMDEKALAEIVFPRALAAHRRAQPRGSGIDVCASCFGGHRIVKRVDESLRHEIVSLPDGLHLEVWAAPSSCSTSAMLDLLNAFRHRSPADYNQRLLRQCEASERAAKAVLDADASLFVRSLSEQRNALEALGHDAGAPIVTEAVTTLADAAALEGAAVLPAGAGGGDVAIYAGPHAPSERLKRLAAALQHEVLPMNLGARGVHSAPPKC